MWWGVAAALLANTLYSVGFVLEKRALGALPEVSIRRPARLPRFGTLGYRPRSAARLS